MRKGRDGEQKNQKTEKTEKNDGNSGPLSSLPVDPLNGDRLQRRRSCQNLIGDRVPLSQEMKSSWCKSGQHAEKLF